MAGAKIGANATLLPGVVVGRNALVGAGSVVVNDVPDGKVVVGNPARIIKDMMGDNALMKQVLGAWPMITLSEGLSRTFTREETIA